MNVKAAEPRARGLRAGVALLVVATAGAVMATGWLALDAVRRSEASSVSW